MKDKKIKIVKNWLESKSMHDIQIFLGLANFYWRFILSFSKIARPLILMLKIMSPTGSSTISQSLINAADENKVVKVRVVVIKRIYQPYLRQKSLPEQVIYLSKVLKRLATILKNYQSR